ncbi:hypothetical protein AAFF_G00090410 [Aldrovandia affinis]|uniref:Reverse transcriptase/retrotransposon-derived protein RNase H-like domain-containing protein n=1 Tax=Aldrovandia affinis TaxID=143900 RepID=A0AAD7RVY1_9TELE|nr:hypothetical protein AAFF_G00090410 [Aldrovandia affinis]
MQFELAAELNGWPMDSGKKAARLVLSLTDDALACLTALGPVEQRDYGAVVGALQRRFGRCDNKSIVVTELCNRHRRPGESLRALATDVETLTRRAYGHMPPAVLSEYARDQFVRAIEPRDLRERVQLRHPSTLQEALELALEREELRGETTQGGMREVSPRAHALLGVWPGRPSPQGLPRSPGEAGKRQGVRLGGAERTPGAMSHADLSPAEGAKRHSWGSGALLPPGAGDGAESVMVVGWTHAGNFCYVPVALAGAPCSALVDTGSTATLMRPDMVPVGTQLEQTSVQLRTVTGELAPMLGRGKVVITVGGLSVELRVWVAEVQDPCILGLDFLKFARCLLDLGENTLSFPGGPTVRMISPPRSSSSPHLPAVHPCPHQQPRSHPVPPSLAQPNMEEEADRLAVVRGIWERSCGHLEPEQQEELWQLLTEFKGIFALTDAEIGRTHLVHHQIDTGDARPIRSPPRRLPMAYREAAECAIDEMQHAGIIEPSASPWASGVVMVKKKNTSKMRFCVDYRPLNKEKGADFTWAPECQQAFDLLKNALTEAPVLRPPDLSLPFVLDTDASNVGMGAVLSQVGPEGERAVAYFSHTFNKAERNYCVTRRELLAVVKAVRHFRYYLCGLPFTIRTDHAALQWLMSFREPEGQVCRWLEKLADFNFTVEHRAGARHTNADALSRRPCAPGGCRYCEKREARERELREEVKICPEHEGGGPVCRELQVIGAAEWRTQQEQDSDLQPVLQWVETGQRPPWGEVAGGTTATKGLWADFAALRVCDGVLQRAWREPATGENSHRTPRTLSVPEQQQQQVDLTGATRPRRRRRPPGRFEDFV